MLPEAIAIVCSPNHKPEYYKQISCVAFLIHVKLNSFFFIYIIISFGIFRITAPNGLKEIANCRIKEPFHPHESNQMIIYNV